MSDVGRETEIAIVTIAVHDAVLENALHKLRWGAEQNDWSASLTPAECLSLLREFDEMRSALQGSP